MISNSFVDDNYHTFLKTVYYLIYKYYLNYLIKSLNHLKSNVFNNK